LPVNRWVSLRSTPSYEGTEGQLPRSEAEAMKKPRDAGLFRSGQADHMEYFTVNIRLRGSP
jgi:hypothetical protein